jgi:hypothetical protein
MIDIARSCRPTSYCVKPSGHSACERVWAREVHEERSPVSKRLMRPDLVAERYVARYLLDELRRAGNLALAEVLVLERLVEALDDTVGLGALE